jgi:hypothetical protein
MCNEPTATYNADYALEVWDDGDVSPISHSMDEGFFQKFDAAFEKMIPEEKWTLSTGKVVEDEMFKLAKRCKFEQ